jgi:N-glycosylase/DNA lyase
MKSILLIIEKHKSGPIKDVIDKRMSEFEAFRSKTSNDIYKELCFCFMTANFNAKKSIAIQAEIDNGFLNWSEEKLAETLTELGHRFPNARAKYMFESQNHKDTIKETLESFENENKIREWIVQNIKGIGMKEASHFLRNIGYKNVAIIDFHIVDSLARHGLIEQPASRSLTQKQYLEIEGVLRKISEAAQIPLGELDLYLWYEETGTVLK